jgi:hypothetical protein
MIMMMMMSLLCLLLILEFYLNNVQKQGKAPFMRPTGHQRRERKAPREKRRFVIPGRWF